MAIYFYQNIYPNSKSIKEKKKKVKKENKIQIVLYIYLDIMKKIKGKKYILSSLKFPFFSTFS